jgi:two-component system, response regulator, stage 0 sporulation protein F
MGTAQKRLGAPTSTANTSHVLIVDDEPEIRAPLRMLFEDAGYAVYEASDGLDAVELLVSSTTPLIVLLDLKMRGMSGYELLYLLAGKPAWAARHTFLVVTAVSGLDGLDDVMPLLQRLSIHVVSKPFDIDDILAAVAAERARLQAVLVH